MWLILFFSHTSKLMGCVDSYINPMRNAPTSKLRIQVGDVLSIASILKKFLVAMPGFTLFEQFEVSPRIDPI